MTDHMNCVSQDGTAIAFDRKGSGPPVILIDGALCYRESGPNRALADALRERFTVFTYDRRGRGESGDAPYYEVTREVEDIAALIDVAGAPAHLYGISTGGALALETAKRLPGKVASLALYEIPFVVDDSRPPVAEDFKSRLQALLVADRRSAAIKLFMREAARLPSPLVAAMPLFPGWSKNKAIAHTLANDVAIMGDTQRGGPLPADRWASITQPTLVADGGKSPAWLRNAAAQLAQRLPHARVQTLDGQRHYVKAAALAPVLGEFIDRAVTASAASSDHAPGRNGTAASHAAMAARQP